LSKVIRDRNSISQAITAKKPLKRKGKGKPQALYRWKPS
jgi:hypothetical protein